MIDFSIVKSDRISAHPGSDGRRFKTFVRRAIVSKDTLIVLVTGLALVVLCTGVSRYKIKLIKQLPAFDPNDGTGFYWTESASHFRHARMVAEGKGIPVVDTGMQYPEGLNTRRYLTTLPDWFSGRLYRLLSPDVPLHVFLIHFVSVFSTLSVVAVFLTGRFLWRSDLAGLLSALFYSLTPASFVRTTAGLLLREDFALPFIFFSFACFIYCLRKDRPIVAVIGSLLLAVALAAWHMTRFYLLVFVVGLAVVFLLQKKQNFPRLGFTIFTAITAACALILPVLRAKLFIFSFPLMLSYAILIPLWLPQMSATDESKRRLWSALTIILFLAGAFIIQKYSGSYSHVWALMLAKLRFFARPPLNPALLPFEARVFWAAGFVTPTPKAVLVLLSSTGLLGVVALLGPVQLLLKERNRGEIMIFVFLAVSFLLLFFLIYRLHVFAAFFLSLPIGYLVTLREKLVKIIAYIFILGALALTVHSLRSTRIGSVRPPKEYVNDIIRFINDNSSDDEAVLSSFAFGPAVAAYAERPVILHSSFESKQIRDKVRRMYDALYGGEDDFYRLCREYGAKMFVYESAMALTRSPGSIRYTAGNTVLAKNSAAALFQFAPEKLNHFSLVYQNELFRLYRVVEKAAAPSENILYAPQYDLSFYCNPAYLGDTIDDQTIAAGLNRLRIPQMHLKLAEKFRSEGQLNNAILQYQRALVLDPTNTGIVLDLGQAMYNSAEQKEKGLQILRMVVAADRNLDAGAIDIRDAEFWIIIGRDELVAFRHQRAESFLRKAIELDPQSDQAYNLLGRVQAASGQHKQAITSIEKSLSLNPDQPQLKTLLQELKKYVNQN